MLIESRIKTAYKIEVAFKHAVITYGALGLEGCLELVIGSK